MFSFKFHTFSKTVTLILSITPRFFISVADNGPEQAIAAANDNGVYSSSCIPVDVNVCEHQEIVAIVEDGDNATDSITGSSPIDVCPQGATLVDTIDCESATRVTEESHRVSLGAIEVHNNHAPAVSDAIQNCSGRPEASNTQVS